MEACNTLARFLIAGNLMGLIGAASAYDFYVGGKNGWVPNPSESYNTWAARNRFQINDRLVFKYKKGADSVLVVNKENYDSCNVTNPIQKLDGGDSIFKLDRSGPFFFISGVAGRCAQGEKMIVVVLSAKNKTPTPPPPTSSPSPSPSSSPSSPSPSPSPSSSPSSPSPSPSPSSSPVSSPSPSATAPSAGTPSGTPASSPAGSGLSPSQSPTSGSGSGSGTGVSPASSPESSPSAAFSNPALTVSSFLIGVLTMLVLGSASLC